MRLICVLLALLVVIAAAQNTGATVAWANSECDENSQWLCAEFVARSLSAGGFISGLAPTDPTSEYEDFNGYALTRVGGDDSQPGLYEYLTQKAGFTQQTWSASDIQAGWVIMGDAGEGSPWSHTCLGVGPGIIDCHNIAACSHSADGYFDSINAILGLNGAGPTGPTVSGPASNSGSGSGSSGSSGGSSPSSGSNSDSSTSGSGSNSNSGSSTSGSGSNSNSGRSSTSGSGSGSNSNSGSSSTSGSGSGSNSNSGSSTSGSGSASNSNTGASSSSSTTSSSSVDERKEKPFQPSRPWADSEIKFVPRRPRDHFRR